LYLPLIFMCKVTTPFILPQEHMLMLVCCAVSIASWVVVGSLASQVWWKPYADQEDNTLDSAVLAVIYVRAFTDAFCGSFLRYVLVHPGFVCFLLHDGPGAEWLQLRGWVQHAEPTGLYNHSSFAAYELRYRHAAHCSIHGDVSLFPTLLLPPP
jgi:hypothetical protein